MNEKIINIENKNIFYTVYGNGKPIMLVHGFGEDSRVWKPLLAPSTFPKGEGSANAQSQLSVNSLMNGKYKLIIPDLPGSGKSEMIDDMSMEGMAEVLKIILEKEFSEIPPLGGFRGAAMIGHSMGGYITLAFAEKHSELLTSFGLFHSSAFADSEEKKAIRQKGIDFVQQNGAFQFLKTTIPNLYSPETKSKNAELIENHIQSCSNFSDEAIVSYYKAMIQRPDRTKVLKHTKKPVLFIIGEYDMAVPKEDSLKQCHIPDLSYITLLKQSGHMGMVEEPDASIKALAEFLSC